MSSLSGILYISTFKKLPITIPNTNNSINKTIIPFVPNNNKSDINASKPNLHIFTVITIIAKSKECFKKIISVFLVFFQQDTTSPKATPP